MSASEGEVLRTFPASGPEDINKAVKSAQDAYQEWSRLSGFQRGKLLQKAAQILRVGHLSSHSFFAFFFFLYIKYLR